MKTHTSKKTLLVGASAALLALGAGCTSAEQAARDAAMQTRQGKLSAVKASEQLCALGAKGRAIAQQEAATLKADAPAGALRVALTQALLCTWNAGRDTMSETAQPADDALVETLRGLYAGEPDAAMRTAILQAWNRDLFPLAATFRVSYPLLGAALPTLKTPEARKPVATMLLGPHFGDVAADQREAITPQREAWCQHIGAHIPETIAPATDLWQGAYAISSDLQMAHMNLVQHGCFARTRGLYTGTWDEIDRRLDPVYAAEKKAQLEAKKPELVAARFASQALTGLGLGASQTTRDALAWPEAFKADAPIAPAARLGSVVSRARISALSQWTWAAAAGKRDPKLAAQIVDLYLEKPRSCLTLEALFGVAFGDISQGRETLLAGREDAVKTRIELYAARCPAVFIGLPKAGWQWLGADRARAFKEKIDAAHKEAGLNLPVLQGP